MDDPSSSENGPRPGTLVVHQHQDHSPRRRRHDEPFVTSTATPTESPERRRKGKFPEGVKTGIDRPILREENVMSKSSNTQTARGGHQFTVGNISNGLIYLRPVARPARDLQQFTLPPTTPPSSAEEPEGKNWQQDCRESGKQLPPTPPPKTPPRKRSIMSDEDTPDSYMKSSPPIPRTRHQRAHSYSTINESVTPYKPPDFGGFRMKVEQVDGPSEERPRPRTAGHQETYQTLDVQIPDYSLGSPHFSPDGTPFLYGASSLHVPSIQVERESSPSLSLQADLRWLWPGVDARSFTPSPVPSREASPLPSEQLPGGQIQHVASSLSLAGMSRLRISPEMYDILSFPPGSEDPSVVRYDKRTQEITAAVPARIISQITSAKFVDYHLLSDFFLTFRLFMQPSDLVAYLIARLRWAIDREDDTGSVVRVRTFVAIRHWLLNYFADDFIPSLPLREDFAKALNNLSNAVRENGQPSDMKIIRELKRCWRRTCTLYWDTPAGSDVSIDQDILPGGPPGSRFDSGRLQSTLLRPRKSAPRLGALLPDHSTGTEAFIQEVVGASVAARAAGGTPLRSFSRPVSNFSNDSTRTPSLPYFSLENRSKSTPAPSTSSPLKPKPSQTTISLDVAGLVGEGGKKYRPTPHKRSGSFSDALRDTRQPLPLPKSIARSTHLLMALPYAGSLVRGNLFPPTPAYVEVVAPSTPVSELPSYGFLAPSDAASGSVAMQSARKTYDPNHGNKTLHGPGMKRFLGSVRRALSGKVGNGAGPHGSGGGGMRSPLPTARPARGRSPLGPMPGNLSLSKFMAASSSGHNVAMLENGKAARIDLLGAGVVEAFQRAMQEELSNDDGEWISYDITLGEGEKGSSLHKSQVQLDGAGDGGSLLEAGLESALSEDGCNAPEPSETPPSPSIATQSSLRETVQQHPDFGLAESVISENANMVGGTGSIYGRGNLLDGDFQSTIFSEESRQARRSKSFSFERTPSLFNQHYGSMHRKPSVSPRPGAGGKSLHSARSFSIKRVRSGVSQFSSIMDDNSETFSYISLPESKRGNLQPARMLRRRPGGDLRLAATVGDLDGRPRSAGSIGTGNFSDMGAFGTPLQQRPNSIGATESIHPQQRVPTGIISLGAVAEGASVPMDNILADGEKGCSEADAKASFEAGVQKLRDLPDFESDDGGIEVALMKLEGTYQKRASDLSPRKEKRPAMSFASGRSFISQDSLVIVGDAHSERTFGMDGSVDDDEYMRRMKRRHKQVFDHVPLDTPPILEGGSAGNSSTNLSTNDAVFRDESEASGPILERGLSVHHWNFRETVTSSNLSLPPLERGMSFGSPPIHRGLSPRPSPNGSDLRKIDTGLAKYLDKGSSSEQLRDDMSELSSEISFEMVQPASKSTTKFPPMQPGTIIAELGIPSHPLRHPPSPPLTLEKSLSTSPNNASPSTIRQPRSPISSPRAETFPRIRAPGRASADAILGGSGPRYNDMEPTLRPTSIHLPFILAYDSELLAKQFTLIEKDALMEVDWKELVELKWSQTSSTVRDWVEFLNSKDTRGVEVVIARFNLMCKWARSEIVMTKDIDERAKTIVKFIHIAAHARRLQNFATMYQITIALLTADVTRLRRTWSLVSPADLSTFKEMEALVQPVRNFHNLRAEMDKVTGESGCIPFVGIFTHDLILNAGRPLVISTSPDSEPLINFERHRTTASTVKRLLRLIEASHKYDFKAVDGVCERCLWIASLTDEEIRDLSKSLQ
ncbi:hypothetical protein L873DRAFT_1708181 [Choiromyces venosus 120613-1]|uniref:Ras GEF n=1 Tax=Choiromyces venosus 120613-1 TaxID=1336337 RepID=A0A3N4J882_9PEZI|nr:hypothetical protein L873DRAFT_1708181 [Choiromyces venosus 120613-1]